MSSSQGYALTAQSDSTTIDYTPFILSSYHEPGDVLIQFLAAPVNQVDILVLQGRYNVKPKNEVSGLPVIGFDGVAKVISSCSTRFQPGDLVIPRGLGLGTWRTHAVVSETELLKLPAGTDPLAGAILRSGAIPAWLLLEGVVQLKPDDWIIVSGGTSTVVQVLLQLAALKSVKAVTVIRDRPDFDETKARLQQLGAARVVSQSELERGITDLPPFVLALDCVFGSTGQKLAESLAPGGTYATFGFLSGPTTSISVTPQLLFFKSIQFRGFRGSKFVDALSDEQFEGLLAKVAKLFQDGSIKTPSLEVVEWKRNQTEGGTLVNAVETTARKELGTRKRVFVFTD